MDPNYLYGGRARYYDLIYHFVDYPALAAKLHGILSAEGLADGARLLEVACGTGRYLEQLNLWYRADGLDLSGDMLAIAQRRLPTARLLAADMTDFSMTEPYDALVCLFSSIGYLHTDEQIARALACFGRAVVPDGLLVIEPFVQRVEYADGRPVIQTFASDDLHLARAVVSASQGTQAVFDFQWLVAPRGGPVEHFTEHHELRFFDPASFMALLANAGFAGRFINQGLIDDERGLVIARKR